MTLAEIFKELFSGFYTPGLWTVGRWSLNAYPHTYPKYDGLLGVDITDSDVYCFGSFTRRREKDGPLETRMFNFVWEKDITRTDFYTPGLCELDDDMAVSIEKGLALFSVAFKESLANKGIRVLETSSKI